MNILLTNDDGYDSPGIQALARRLGEFAEVTIVAPRDDQSAMGRVYSGEFDLVERDLGYAVSGTPVDCVVAGVEALELRPDLVVAGCNIGANLGGHALGRSGTISAAVEATFFSIPAIAVSLHVPDRLWPLDARPAHFELASDATAYLVEQDGRDDILVAGDYLNVNVPFEADPPIEMRVTQPSEYYDMSAIRDGRTITIHDRTWDGFDDHPIDEPTLTDRGAVQREMISVSPLTAPHQSVASVELDRLIEKYQGTKLPDPSD